MMWIEIKLAVLMVFWFMEVKDHFLRLIICSLTTISGGKTQTKNNPNLVLLAERKFYALKSKYSRYSNVQ